MIVGASDETDATDVTAEYEEIMTRKYPSYEIRKTCIFNCSIQENILRVFFILPLKGKPSLKKI